MSEELVQHVEDFCDRMEALPQFAIFGKPISIPASVAALRAFYYVEKKYTHALLNERLMIYECLYYVLTDQRCGWNNLSDNEKIALLGRIDAIRVLVFY